MKSQYPATNIRPSPLILAKIEYLKEKLGITTLSGVIWHCINFAYRAEKFAEKRGGNP